MTQAQALLAVRERLDESTSTAWTDAELRRWINEGVEDIVQRTECLQSSDTISAVAGTRSYTLSQRIIRINRVTYQPSGDSRIFPLEYRDFNAMDSVWWTQQAVTSNTPIYFTLWGYPPALQLVVYPTPPTAGTFTVFYYATPMPLATDGSAASSSLTVPTGWESVVVDYAEYTALRKDMQPRWLEAKQLYEEHIEKLMMLSRRWSDQGGVVANYGFDGMVGGAPAWLVNG